MKTLEENYDIVVVGAGHAGCEAALAAARLGFETIIFTVSVDSIAMMPCNPNIGGSTCRRKTGARYHYVYSQCREYCTDALQSQCRGQL